MEIITLINPTGRVIRVDKLTAQQLLSSERPFKEIFNPKQDYYPQYDTSIPEYRRTTMEQVKKLQVEGRDYLEDVEWV